MLLPSNLFTVELKVAHSGISQPYMRKRKIKRMELEEIADFIKHLHPKPSAKLKILIKLLESKSINRENPTP